MLLYCIIAHKIQDIAAELEAISVFGGAAWSGLAGAYDILRAGTAFFERYDLLLTPQMPVGAWSVERGLSEIDGKPTPSMFDRLNFTFPFNFTGQPAASVPCGFTSEGLPVALQIVGRWHADRLVLQAAAACEQAAPWVQVRPALAAA